jgi:hypothetical protein
MVLKFSIFLACKLLRHGDNNSIIIIYSFRCSVCDREMWSTNFYFEKNGMLFCKDDYYLRYGEICQQCGEVVSGLIMISGDHRFHPECFCCKLCKGVIGDGMRSQKQPFSR